MWICSVLQLPNEPGRPSTTTLCMAPKPNPMVTFVFLPERPEGKRPMPTWIMPWQHTFSAGALSACSLFTSGRLINSEISKRVKRLRQKSLGTPRMSKLAPSSSPSPSVWAKSVWRRMDGARRTANRLHRCWWQVERGAEAKPSANGWFFKLYFIWVTSPSTVTQDIYVVRVVSICCLLS